MTRWDPDRSWPQQRAEGFRSSRALGITLTIALSVAFVGWFIIGLAVIAGWGAK